MTPTKTLLAVGASFRFCGYDYVVQRIEPDKRTGQPLLFQWGRRPECGEGDTPFRFGRSPVADVRDSGEGWLYLPQMVRGKLKPRMDQAVATEHLTREVASALTRAIQAHPDYLLGRDDRAEDAMLAAFGLPALPEAPWPSRLREDQLPPKLERGAVEQHLERARVAREG